MDFDISALPLVRDEAPTIASTLALPMTRRKVLVNQLTRTQVQGTQVQENQSLRNPFTD